MNIIVKRQENALTIPKGAVTYAVSFQNSIRPGGKQNAQSPAGSLNSERPNSSISGVKPRPNLDSAGGAAVKGNPVKEDAIKGDAQKQRNVVIVLDAANQPVPRQVVLGLADISNYEVVEGLYMGEKVIVGSLGPNTGGAGIQGGNPLMPGGGGMVRIGGAGR